MKDDLDLLALGHEVRRLREERDLTHEELAGSSGLHPNYIAGIERGESNASVKALFKLARGLKVTRLTTAHQRRVRRRKQFA